MKQIKIKEKTEFFFERAVKTKDQVTYNGKQHYHDLFEIYYLESGVCHYFIDDKSYELLPGDIAIIPAGVIHNTKYQNVGYTRLLLNFSTKYIPAQVMPTLKSIGFLYRNQAVTDQMHQILLLIEKEYEQKDAFSDEVLRCYMNLLFVLMFRNSNCYDDKMVRKEYIEKAIQFVQTSFQDPELSLSSVAHRFSVSSEHFSREFKKETGFGFCEYINLLRIKKSEMLIKEKSGESVTEISHRCGFNDSNYFSVKFKKMYGISPKKMQQSLHLSREKDSQTKA